MRPRPSAMNPHTAAATNQQIIGLQRNMQSADGQHFRRSSFPIYARRSQSARARISSSFAKKFCHPVLAPFKACF
jgi:hypothetical protein